MKQSRKQKALIDIINKMFELAGHQVTFDNIQHRTDNWFLDWEITREQEQEWIDWSVEHLRKELKIPKYKAKKEMLFISMNFGLKTKQDEKQIF